MVTIAKPSDYIVGLHSTACMQSLCMHASSHTLKLCNVCA